MQDISARIHQKKKQLDALRPLPTIVLEKLRNHIAIEWTYNSNAIEGNTLSIRETKMVLEEGVTIKGKSLREHFEAKNHEDAIYHLEHLVQQKKSITENDILDIHALVLKSIERDFAGRYRNAQVRITGANFIPPAGHKVPDLMENFTAQIKERSKQENIVQTVTWVHHRFVWIHPFFDGNGRTARLLMNLILMQTGYPPAIILKNDRKKYYEALNKANNGKYEKLHLLIAQAIERSLDMYISACSQTEKSTYMPLSKLAPHTPYTAEYLGILARAGKIDAYKEKRNWVSTLEAIQQYRA